MGALVVDGEAAAGQTCTLPGSGYSFINTTATSSIVTYTVFGNVSDGSGAPPTWFEGVIQAGFSTNYQKVIEDVGVLGGQRQKDRARLP